MGPWLWEWSNVSGLSLNLIIVLRENRKLDKVFHYPKHWKGKRSKIILKIMKKAKGGSQKARQRAPAGLTQENIRKLIPTKFPQILLISISELYNFGKSYAISQVRIPFYWKAGNDRTWGRLRMNLWLTHGHAFSSWYSGSRSHVVTGLEIFFDHWLVQYDCVLSYH